MRGSKPPAARPSRSRSIPKRRSSPRPRFISSATISTSGSSSSPAAEFRSSMARATSRGCGAKRGFAIPTAISSSSTRPANRAASRRGGSKTRSSSRESEYFSETMSDLGSRFRRNDDIRRLDAAALFLQARARLSAAAGRRGRGGLRAARRAGRGRGLHPRPRQISARHRRFSKNLPLNKREAIYARLMKCAAWGVGIATVEEIDQINIYWARMLAMTRAVEALGLEPAWVLVDGNATARAGSGRRKRSSTATPSAARSPPPRSSPRSPATA